MSYVITIKNMYDKEIDKFQYFELDTISPSLITNPISPYEEYSEDMLIQLGFVVIPLYLKQQYCIIPKSSSLTITTDSVDEAIYYCGMELKNAVIEVNPNPISGKSSEDYSELFSALLSRSLDNLDFLRDSDITEVGSLSLSGMGNIAEIVVPSNIEKIGSSAFSSYSNATSITVEDGVKVIGNGAFSGCRSVTSISLPTTLTTIDMGAFSNCTSLEEIEVPDGITYIPQSFVGGCGKLKHIIIPSTVESIHASAFSGVGYAVASGENVVIAINKPEGSISGSPWGTAHATTVEWVG